MGYPAVWQLLQLFLHKKCEQIAAQQIGGGGNEDVGIIWYARTSPGPYSKDMEEDSVAVAHSPDSSLPHIPPPVPCRTQGRACPIHSMPTFVLPGAGEKQKFLTWAWNPRSSWDPSAVLGSSARAAAGTHWILRIHWDAEQKNWAHRNLMWLLQVQNEAAVKSRGRKVPHGHRAGNARHPAVVLSTCCFSRQLSLWIFHLRCFPHHLLLSCRVWHPFRWFDMLPGDWFELFLFYQIKGDRKYNKN